MVPSPVCGFSSHRLSYFSSSSSIFHTGSTACEGPGCRVHSRGGRGEGTGQNPEPVPRVTEQSGWQEESREHSQNSGDSTAHCPDFPGGSHGHGLCRSCLTARVLICGSLPAEAELQESRGTPTRSRWNQEVSERMSHCPHLFQAGLEDFHTGQTNLPPSSYHTLWAYVPQCEHCSGLLSPACWCDSETTSSSLLLPGARSPPHLCLLSSPSTILTCSGLRDQTLGLPYSSWGT